MMGKKEKKKNLYRLIMLKACITDRRYTVDKHTRTLITNQTHTIMDGTKNKKTLYMYKYVQMPI